MPSFPQLLIPFKLFVSLIFALMLFNVAGAQDPSPTPLPTLGFTLSNITHNSADLSWGAPGPDFWWLEWKLYRRPTNDAGTVRRWFSVDSRTITDRNIRSSHLAYLAPGRRYRVDFNYYERGALGAVIAARRIIEFDTLPAPTATPAPINLEVHDITSNSACLRWTELSATTETHLVTTGGKFTKPGCVFTDLKPGKTYNILYQFRIFDRNTGRRVYISPKWLSLSFTTLATPSDTPSPTPSPTDTASPTATPTPSVTPSPNATLTPSPTDTPSPTATATPINLGLSLQSSGSDQIAFAWQVVDNAQTYFLELRAGDYYDFAILDADVFSHVFSGLQADTSYSLRFTLYLQDNSAHVVNMEVATTAAPPPSDTPAPSDTPVPSDTPIPTPTLERANLLASDEFTMIFSAISKDHITVQWNAAPEAVAYTLIFQGGDLFQIRVADEPASLIFGGLRPDTNYSAELVAHRQDASTVAALFVEGRTLGDGQAD